MIYTLYIEKGKLRDELERCRKEENFGYFVPLMVFIITVALMSDTA